MGTQSSAPQLDSRQRRCGISDGPWMSASPARKGTWAPRGKKGIPKDPRRNPSPSPVFGILWVPCKLSEAWHKAHRSPPQTISGSHLLQGWVATGPDPQILYEQSGLISIPTSLDKSSGMITHRDCMAEMFTYPSPRL